MTTYLKNFTTDEGNDGYASFEDSLQLPIMECLSWPTEVIEQLLWDHGSSGHFIQYYGNIDLERVQWTCEDVTAMELAEVPTGASDANFLDEVAENHQHWLDNRKRLKGIVDAWEADGTRVTPPILIKRSLLDAPAPGLQVVEARNRVGILRGRLRDGLNVAAHHRAWVGRPNG